MIAGVSHYSNSSQLAHVHVQQVVPGNKRTKNKICKEIFITLYQINHY